ncbi:hypothetical protein C806_02737 [Lachnospiraceae bacterium 3-1]|nr:hypothetical protein C806_02737 [Lachnospiraceae bacterium 3-1]
MKIVVTGATGFVGQWLVNELLDQNDDVTILVRNKERIPKKWKGCVHMVEASMEQASGLDKKEFPCGEADIFIHLAWAGASGLERADSQLQLQNVQFSCDMVKLAGKLHCSRFVNAGSIMEYEAMQYIPQEGAMPGMGNIYSTAKLAADFMGKATAINLGIEYINLIISNIYGAGEHSARFLNTTLRRMLNHEQIPLTHGKQLYDFIYASDAAKAIALAGKKGKGNTAYYIGNSRQYPLKDFVLQMKKVLGSKSELLFGKAPFQGAMLRYDEFDTGKLEELGYRTEIDFAKGVNLTKEWILGEKNDNKF